MMATAFMGYVLPWGQMSFWGATVITNLFSAIPGGRRKHRHAGCGAATPSATRRCNRFFSLHYLLPFVIAGVVALHVWALHVAGQNNPAGIDVKSDKDVVPFTPYATIKDALGHLGLLAVLLAGSSSTCRTILGDRRRTSFRRTPAVTPAAHRAGMVLLCRSTRILRGIPRQARRRHRDVLGHPRSWRSCPGSTAPRTRSSRYRPIAKQFFWIFVAVCLGLGWLGSKPAEGIYTIASRVLTFCYFALLPDRAAGAEP